MLNNRFPPLLPLQWRRTRSWPFQTTGVKH
jgi:hypothetical protein